MSERKVATVGLVLHPTKPVEESIATLAAWVAGQSGRLLARERDRARVPAAVEAVSDDELAKRSDALVALGGDGTMLGAMRLALARPVLGVNHGNLGFLVEVTPAGLAPALARLSAGDFTVEPHACLAVETPGVPLATPAGFNDVVLARLGRSDLIALTAPQTPI